MSDELVKSESGLLPRGMQAAFVFSMVRSAVVGVVARYVPDLLAIDGVKWLLELGCIALASFIAARISTRSRAKGELAAQAEAAGMLGELSVTPAGHVAAEWNGAPTLTGTRVGGGGGGEEKQG